MPPPPGQTPPDLYGAVTATAASVVEIQAPDRRRVFSLATTADWDTVSADTDRQLGQPTSWSASIDALAAGLEIDVDDDGLLYLNEDQLADRRLFLISAGNVLDLEDDHLARSDVEPIEDPAQAWNALTIGAHTELTDASSGPGFTGWTPLAPEGELSPFSRTAVLFELALAAQARRCAGGRQRRPIAIRQRLRHPRNAAAAHHQGAVGPRPAAADGHERDQRRDRASELPGRIDPR